MFLFKKVQHYSYFCTNVQVRFVLMKAIYDKILKIL